VDRMQIGQVTNFLMRPFRVRRMQRFAQAFSPSTQDRILDVGGSLFNWQLINCTSQIDLLNLEAPPTAQLPGNVRYIVGDGTDLKIPDGSYDIVFSNSVIEHVGSPQAQAAFANELRRVGRKLWLQTPARSFPVEPHLLGLFVHWLPKPWQKKLIKNFTLWGWITRAPQSYIDGFVDQTRLLNHKELVALFPDCKVHRERFFFLTKSYLVVRS